MDEVKENSVKESSQYVSAGDMLRNARTTGRRKREIQTVAKQLCIREEFLQALEDCNYTFLPELVYVLGFARNYAIELGLDPDVIIAKIKSEMGVVPEGVFAAPGEVIPDVPTKNTIKFKEMWASVRQGIKKAVSFVKNNWLWFALGLGVLVLAIVALLIFGGEKTEQPVPPLQEVVVEQQSNEPVYNIPVRERFGTENVANAEVVLQAIEDSYVAVENAKGKVVFGRSLVAGDVYFVPEGKHKAKFGNAGGIDVWVNGELAPKVGKSHVAKSGIVLTPDSLMPKK